MCIIRYKNFIYKKISMKKSLKNLGLTWLAALSLSTTGQKTLASETEQNKKNILQVLDTNKISKTDESKNYNTASDFKEQQIVDSTEIVGKVKEMNIFTDNLVKFYGKEKLSKKIQDIKIRYPNLLKLPPLEQKDLISKEFADFFKEYPSNDMIVLLFGALLMTLWVLMLHNSSRKTYR